MDKDLKHRAKPFFAKKRKRKLWQQIVSVLGCAVVFCTTYALILPAITKEHQTFCGIEAHTHGDGCYSPANEYNFIKLDCPVEDMNLHVHTEACRDEAGRLLCGEPDYVVHSHGEGCFDGSGTLVCGLPERAQHVHTDACYDPVPGHSHGEGCYDESGALSCAMEEVPDGTLLVCTEPEAPVHNHIDRCFETITAQTRTCTLAEDETHTHGSLCSGVWMLTCQTEIHEHSIMCYSNPNADVESRDYWDRTFGNLTLTGVWSEDLLTVARKQLGYAESDENYVLLADGTTVHGYTRYGDWMGDPYGDWCAMYISFCLNYAGVTDMPRHYSCTGWIEELKILDLYRPGGLYIPNPGDLIFFDWENNQDVDHVGIVAQVLPATADDPATIKTIEGNSNNQVQYRYYRLDASEITGYGILPENPELTYPCGMDPHTHGKSCFNADGTLVCILTEHDHTDTCFDSINYGCGINYHAHTGACYGEDDALICQIPEHIHNADCVERTVAYISDEMRVYVTIRAVEHLPADLKLNVWSVTDRADYDSMASAMSQQIAEDTQYISQASVFQMELQSGGLVYELPETAEVTVQVKFNHPIFNQDDVEAAVDLHTFVLKPEETEPVTVPETEPTEATEPSAPEADPPEEGLILPVSQEPPAPSEDSDSLFSFFTGYRRSGETGTEPTDPVSYTAQEPSDAALENADDGLTGLSYSSNGLSAFAVTLATNIQEGTFWTKVDSASDITADGTYLIVSAEGNYALVGSQGNTTATASVIPVTLQTVKGNTDYYVITGSDNANIRWNITPGSGNYTIRNQGTSNYLRMASIRTGGNSWWPTYTDYLMHSGAGTVKLEYVTPENCWRISNGSNYLRKIGTSGYFTYGSGNDGSYGSTYYNYTRNMMIFKLSDVTSLEVPEDPDKQNLGTTPGVAPEKPDYDPFIVPSDGKTGDTAVIDTADSTIKVNGKYYSDPATSCLEDRFRMDTLAEYQQNDGKILTDKSVIYGDDDYDAFESYDPNTFGITLSALGQEYPLSEEDTVVTPVDIVFVLDVSGSMATNDNSGSSANRAIDMTTAVNNAISHIMEAHPENRVGVVVYSSGAWTMLPLDRYTANNDQYFVCSPETRYFSPSGHSATVYMVKGSSSLRSEDGISYAGIGGHATQGLGTYTQAGIAQGYSLFEAVEDTTYTVTIGEGEDERSYTVARQPVYILLSDGEPTHGTNLYMDVMAGPVYGDGNGNLQPDTDYNSYNPKGILGYYTILSANYYKRMAGIHYDNPAMFFTIGMGINETGSAPLVTNSGTADHYKRAVLNPTVENITNLTGGSIRVSETVDQLRTLLLGSFSGGQQIALRSNWPDSWTGVPQKYIPVLPSNPYPTDYSYADDAYFGRMTDEDLTEIFDEILEHSITRTSYGFVLHQRSSVDLVDYIGNGMEVKGDPVLRFGGMNYAHTTKTVEGNVTTYSYTGTYTDPYIPNCTYDLSEITVTVTTEVYPTATHQKVEMYIPDTALPTLTPELIGMEYYYEALPVRLIYQVGLTEESEQAVLDLQQTGGSLTFYTNLWEDPLHYSVSTLFPSTGNPFYYDQGDGHTAPYHEHTIDKTDNTTDTLSFSVDCHEDYEYVGVDNMIHVLHELGNNGKLVFEAEVVEIPVEKHWEIVDPDKMEDITLTLYKVVENLTDNVLTRKATAVSTLTLGKDNNWAGTFTAPAPGEGWYYAIGEAVPENFTVFYPTGTSVTAMVDGLPVEMSKVVYDDTGQPGLVAMTNIPDTYVLPNTGGPGTHLYTTGGTLLILLAAIVLLYMHLRCRKEDYPSS